MKMGIRVFRMRLAQKTGAASEVEDVEAGTVTPVLDFEYRGLVGECFDQR